MGIEFLDLQFRLEKSFQTRLPKSWGKEAGDRRPSDITAGDVHAYVCRFLRQSGQPVPHSSWHRVKLCVARVDGTSPSEVKADTRLVKDLDFG